eukprot:FR739214.1.p2 GENE.FR739214.1~~FR739214.1.p2  ORF type:complete len:134 (+),score=17.95 FR739214.1:33-404(+)
MRLKKESTSVPPVEVDAVVSCDPRDLPSPKYLKAVCLANRALVELKRHDPEKAREDAVLAEEHAPGYAKASFRRGAAHEALEEWDLAVMAYERAGRLDPASARAAMAGAARCEKQAHQAPLVR